MREILFRGKWKNTGEWVEGFPVQTVEGNFYIANTAQEYGCGICIQGTEHYGNYKVIPETVGQYTGLTDKNGQWIFEGDIVKFEYVGGNTGLSATETVAFQDGMFGCFWGPNRSFIPLSGFVRYTFEVIGNIHDNPEKEKGQG